MKHGGLLIRNAAWNDRCRSYWGCSIWPNSWMFRTVCRALHTDLSSPEMRATSSLSICVVSMTKQTPAMQPDGLVCCSWAYYSHGWLSVVVQSGHGAGLSARLSSASCLQGFAYRSSSLWRRRHLQVVPLALVSRTVLISATQFCGLISCLWAQPVPCLFFLRLCIVARLPAVWPCMERFLCCLLAKTPATSRQSAGKCEHDRADHSHTAWLLGRVQLGFQKSLKIV